MRTLLSLFLFLLSLNAYAKNSDKCMAGEALVRQAVLIEQFSRGKGSGVLYEDNIVITNQHVIDDIDKDKIWVFIPLLARPVKAKLLHSTRLPDLALLELEEHVPAVRPLTLARNVSKNEIIRLASFPFGDKSRLGVTKGWFNTPARFRSDNRIFYFTAKLADWAYAGDSGGPFFNCEGDLAGINFANFAKGGDPDVIYAINTRGLEEFLKEAGISPRIRY